MSKVKVSDEFRLAEYDHFRTFRPRGRVQLFFNGEGRTKQSFKTDADVNALMAKYSLSQLAVHNAQFQGHYGDFTDVKDYQSSLNEILKAQDMFMTLPSSIRNRFENDPSQFLEFVSNESNRDEMKTLGLLNPEPKGHDKVAEKPVNLDKNAE